MGLKTTNYEVKNLGIVLPEAHAIIKDLMVKGQNGYAIFAIQSSRENAEKVVAGDLSALEEVRVDFDVNRDANDRATAYEKAKGQTVKLSVDMKEILVNEPFYGWQDDIV